MTDTDENSVYHDLYLVHRSRLESTDRKRLDNQTRQPSGSKLVTGFTERQQDLAVVVQRLSTGALIDPRDAAKFSLELMNLHSAEISTIVSHFQSSAVKGLSKNAFARNSSLYGAHFIPKTPETPIWMKFINCFFSGFSPLLWIACFFVFLSWKPFGTPPSNIYNLALAIALLIVIFASGLFTFTQEMQSTMVLSSFGSLVPEECVVIRDGRSSTIPVKELVVGDLVVFETGVRIPADCRVVSTSNLKVDKSVLNGESEPSKLIHERVANTTTMLEAPNMAFMGCNVVEGEGMGIVIATGPNCQLAKIASQVGEVSTPLTSLQVEVNRLATIIAAIAIVVTISVVLEWAFYLRVDHPDFMTTSSMIANAIGILVAFIPEGLPLALTMGLTIIASRLCATHFILIKQLGTIETLGSMSFVASDKTGTLTQNKMTVTGLVVSDPHPKVKATVRNLKSTQLQKKILRGTVICNQAKVDVGANSDIPVAIGSNGVDKALLNMAIGEDCIKDFTTKYETKLMMPFSSATKFTAVVVSALEKTVEAEAGDTVVIVKGAYEYMLDRCGSYFNSEGEAVPITNEFIDDINTALEPMVSSGYRVILLAESPVLPSSEFPANYVYAAEPSPNFPLTGLIFLACVVISDPPREGVKEAVASLRGAGIKIAMVTGDARPTAVAIARAVGIVTANAVDRISNSNTEMVVTNRNGYTDLERGPDAAVPAPPDNSSVGSTKSRSTAVVVEGKEIEGMDPVAWEFIFSHDELVFARTTPEQKLLIVKQAQARGHRVGVTGDGVNDSPALKRADVGIAMQSGSDVARDASAIVLLKDDFNAIVQGVSEGRLIFQNLRKVIAYQMSAGCWGEVLPVLATFFLGMPQPLAPFLMICISCVSDVFAGIALTRESAEEVIMTLPPRNLQKDRLVNFKVFLYSYMFYGNFNAIGCFYMYFLYMANRGPLHQLSTPLPADDDGSINYPIGYSFHQLIGAWTWATNENGLGTDQSTAAIVGSSVYYIGIIACQMGHLLSIRKSTPYFYHTIKKLYQGGEAARNMNWMEEIKENLPTRAVVLAWIGAVLVAILFTETPGIQSSCQTASVPVRFWLMAYGWSFLWFFIAEIRKWCIVLFPKTFGMFSF